MYDSLELDTGLHLHVRLEEATLHAMSAVYDSLELDTGLHLDGSESNKMWLTVATADDDVSHARRQVAFRTAAHKHSC